MMSKIMQLHNSKKENIKMFQTRQMILHIPNTYTQLKQLFCIYRLAMDLYKLLPEIHIQNTISRSREMTRF